MRVERMEAVTVDLAPPTLEPGKLYVSRKYKAAVHLCCCGCGAKVVTPLSSAEWQVEESPRGVSVSPSIGNARPCRTHYWIRGGQVRWHRPMSDAHVSAVFQADARSLRRMHEQQRSAQGPVHRSRDQSRGDFWIQRLLRWLLG